jgi:hypothetical protein
LPSTGAGAHNFGAVLVRLLRTLSYPAS